MYGSENIYLSDENAKGFVKNYKGNKFAFAALLPNEGVDVNDYLNSLDGDRLHAIFSNASNEEVVTSIPKFEFEYSASLSDVLKKMGMPRAFDKVDAEFSGLGKTVDNIYIDEVLHKTFISVDEKGTKAGAVTVVDNTCAEANFVERKEVRLNRPFIYMLIDCETNTPFFIGVLNTPDPEHP